jgi:alginate O-acetyltransferase complex protein AlgI
MLFNSINFAVFLLVVFLLYWFKTQKNLKLQNALLLIASYFFYAFWDYRFLALLLFSTLLDYFSGMQIAGQSTKTKKKYWLLLSISVNLGFLFFFKYYNFFVQSFADAIAHLGLRINIWTLKVVLPVGISFYTFHGLSYIIDVYRGKIQPERNFVNYGVFVSFFPLLVAGPIARANHLLPQIKEKRVFDYTKTVDGLKQILWGLFKKIVIADSCAVYADMIFDHSSAYSGSTLVVGVIMFAFQIYGDFSGYSDIAIGTARLFGIELRRNFAFPYFSRDIAEFWRRWHISLSSWFRDYLYIPLGGSRGTNWQKLRNTFIIFLVSGFWHGANWTFIIWGALNAVYFLPFLLMKKNRMNLDTVATGKLFPSGREFISMLLTFSLVSFSWIFFRSVSIEQAITYIQQLFSASFFTMPSVLPGILIGPLCLFLFVEWTGREQQYALEKLGLRWPRLMRWAAYYLIILAIIFFGGGERPFIYFQF